MDAQAQICVVDRVNEKGFCFLKTPTGATAFLHASDTRLGKVPSVGSLVLCTLVHSADGKCKATEVPDEPLLTLCTVTSVKSDRGFCVVKSQELTDLPTFILHCSNCPREELPQQDQQVLCSVTQQDKRYSARSAIRFPFGPVQCRVEGFRDNRGILRSPAVELGRYDIAMSLMPGMPIPVRGTMIKCWLQIDDHGDLWATTTAPPPPPPVFDGVLVVDCTCLEQVGSGRNRSANLRIDGPSNFAAIVPPTHRLVLQSYRTGLAGLPRCGSQIRCWVRQNSDEPDQWDAWLLAQEARSIPGGRLPVKRIPPNLISGLPPVTTDFGADFELPRAVQEQLSELFEAPAVRLDDNSNSGETLFVLCDSDIVRLADRWNLGMDVIPLSRGKYMWCQLLRFHSALCFDRFSAQLGFYFLSRKNGDDAKDVIPKVPHQEAVCIRAASIPPNEAPIMALDGLTAKIKDDAIQVFEEQGGTIVVARMFIATPFTQGDVDESRRNIDKPDFFDALLPDVLRESRINLKSMYGTPMFSNNDKYCLSSNEERIAACFEQRFAKTSAGSGADAEELFAPIGPMTISLRPCRIHVALTTDQVNAFEDGDLALPQSAAHSLRLLRRLVDSHHRQFLKAQEAAAQADEKGMGMSSLSSDSLWVTPNISALCMDDREEEEEGPADDEKKDDGPCRAWMDVRPEGGIFRITVSDVPTSKALERASLIRFLHIFRDEQNAALFLAFGFTLKSERLISDAQKALLDSKLHLLGLPQPAEDTFEGYMKALHFNGAMSQLLEILGSNTVETKVPALLVDEDFLKRLSADVKADLQSTEPSPGAYWASVDPQVRPRRGVDVVKEVPRGALPVLEMVGGFLCSTHPLREYNHLLTQLLLLVLGTGRAVPGAAAHAAPQRAVFSDSTRLALMKHAIAALLELNHKHRISSTDVNDFFCNDRLPYARTQLAAAVLTDVVRRPGSADGRAELAYLSDDVRQRSTKAMRLMTFEVPDSHPLAAQWPDSFGTQCAVLLRTDPHCSEPREVLLVPPEASLADVVTDADWEALLSPWQGERIKQLIRDNESARKVPIVASALIPGRLC
jgi:hypothetical protein